MRAVSEETSIRERLLASARCLFARQGYEGTSVRQICEGAGANPALVSYYFGGKEAMFEEVFRSLEMSPALASLLSQPHQAPDEGLRTFIREMIAHRLDNPDISRIIQIEKWTESERSQLIREWSMPIWRNLRTFIEEGGRQGLFRYRSLDTALSCVQALLLNNSSSPYWKDLISYGTEEREALVEDMTRFIFRGLDYDPNRSCP